LNLFKKIISFIVLPLGGTYRFPYLNSKNVLFRFSPIQRVKRSDFAMTRKRDKEAKRQKKSSAANPIKQF